MSILSDMFSDGISKVVDSIGNAIDNLVTSDEEKLALKNELAKINVEAQNKKDELDLKYEEQLTQRQFNDMGSDSWLSKNIRPLTLIFILVMYSLLSIGSGFNFTVTESYVQLLGQWGMLIMSFYFGGRTLEKLGSIAKGNK